MKYHNNEEKAKIKASAKLGLAGTALLAVLGCRSAFEPLPQEYRKYQDAYVQSYTRGRSIGDLGIRTSSSPPQNVEWNSSIYETALGEAAGDATKGKQLADTLDYLQVMTELSEKVVKGQHYLEHETFAGLYGWSK